MGILESLGNQSVLPILNFQNPKLVLQTVEALLKGGITNLEVTLRSKDALPILKEIRKEFPDILLGAGTILKDEQIDQVQDIGINFGVCPGWDESIWKKSQKNNFFLIPGILTPSELNRVSKFNCPAIKIFPIEPTGGYPYMKALIAPFRNLGIKYLPTGGVTQHLTSTYLNDPDLLTIGGSWVTPEDLVHNLQFSQITKLAKEAVSLGN
jgi:2-dehydro-3-deoxyphosphogluconate aldolase/(4S)-4-hydroxy-2-oxoglutarate aldolase